ncbi:uncharacterized protein ACLA_096720 [Aspergillus clavatus NRRL 1]|uniref:Uncharacterized protein n=1 Tax=Aspergillus clavatus (strain ATCC 1007 / CBS 513.65 / DSM 816 / NCTC 3887 / NRRL 1 / QM 1276 / 107) TaxID=344612 RepID=A1CMF2_ASPCL|nr:uncharacterized protein ACLA_096720 [Aspergillus clavatus NRRL 1]EAW08739.1 conserved hypothetical protein [Aspergillus clavatus NRRL 1]
MTMENGLDTGTIVGRNVLDSYNPLQSEAKGDYKQIILSTTSPNSSSGLGARARILRASDVLLSLAGRTHDATEKFAGIESFQETLRLFPSLRNDDGTALNAGEAKCPDCDAVFSAYDRIPISLREMPVDRDYQRRTETTLFDTVLPRYGCGSLHDDAGSVIAWKNGSYLLTLAHSGSSASIVNPHSLLEIGTKS